MTEDSPVITSHLDHYNRINKLMREASETAIVEAANYYRDMVEMDGRVKGMDNAKRFLNVAWRSLLEADAYLEAATMNWGYDKFDARPELVQEVFKFIPLHNQMAIMGASSTSKSYSCIAWLYLDYQRDPDCTGVKFVTISEDKLKGLLFSPLTDMHDSSVMDVVGNAKSLSLTHKPENFNVGFQAIRVPPDQQGTGKLKGVKYYRRDVIHPKFGINTRARIFVDEFQDTSSGMLKDIESPMASKDGPDPIKTIISGNPTDYSLNDAFGRVTEPPKGWADFDIEEDHQWVSKEGWDVLRLDGARSENVIHKKQVCQGMQTWEYFDSKCRSGQTAEYFTFARGIFPLRGASSSLFTIPLFEKHVGDAMFHEGSVNVAAVDIGLHHDAVKMSIGRVGQATGKRDRFGTETMFVTGPSDKRSKPQVLLQLDRVETLEGFDGDVVTLAKMIIEIAKKANVKPEHLAVDATGLGEGVFSYISNYYGAALPIRWGEKPTDHKILMEDRTTPDKEYSDIVAELWYAAYKWMTVGAILMSPSINLETLRHEVTTRNVGKGRGGRKSMETKDSWKIRNSGKSPDTADSFIQLIHVARLRTKFLPALEKSLEATNRRTEFRPSNVSYVDSLKFDGLDHKKRAKKEKPFHPDDLRKSFTL